MTRARFLKERKESWRRFEVLLSKFERLRLRKLEGAEVSEFSSLFRAVCYDLATVRSRDWGRELENFLNDLVLRGHNLFYRSPPGRPRQVVHFFTHGFPRLLRANSRYFWVALILFVVPGLISGWIVHDDPSLTGRILSSEQQEMMDRMYSESREGKESHGAESFMAGFYIYNNVGIAFRAFATGIFFGIGTVFFLVYNSIALGTITGFLIARGRSEAFFSFVISHGSFELTAIVIAGAAGLILGHSLIHPGRLTRAESLKQRRGVAIRLAAGAGAMLCVAAFVEAFWSPSGLPNEVKYTVGSGMWIAVIGYLLLAGRSGRPADGELPGGGIE